MNNLPADLNEILKNPSLVSIIAATMHRSAANPTVLSACPTSPTEIMEEESVDENLSPDFTPNLADFITTAMGATGATGVPNIGDTLASTLAKAAEKKVKELTADAGKHAPLAASICCAGCCCSIFVVIVITAHITAFVGLAHTQHVDLDPLCPPHYWDSSIALLFMRLFAAALAFCTICASGAVKKVYCTAATIVCALVTVLSFAIADTAVTAQAWSALNCSSAVRAGRDSDPLLMASGSLFVMIDWILLLCACGAACRACRMSAGVESD